MESAIFMLLLSAVRPIVSAKIPKEALLAHCREAKNLNVTAPDCCPLPELFSSESMTGCGIDLYELAEFPSLRGSPECAIRTCLLRSHDLLFDSDDIDNESVKQFLDEWTARRREYLPAVKLVKELCVGEKTLPGPPQLCNADWFFLCLSGTFYKKCPHWKDSEACTALRSFSEECIPFYQ